MHINYRYVLDTIRNTIGADARVLDYGCGGGEVVQAGRESGYDMYGVDVFYGGSNANENIRRLGYLGTIVREIKHGVIDFPDGYFDIIVNNQVLEHVEDIDMVVGEMDRVLKPGGYILCLFPALEIWREVHCGIPFLHWIPKHSRLAFVYAFIFRLCGFGYFKAGRSLLEWTRHHCHWVDKYTHYRTQQDIVRVFRQRDMQVTHLEVDYILYRIRHKNPHLYRLFRRLARVPLAVWFMSWCMYKFSSVILRVEKLDLLTVALMLVVCG